MFVDIKEEKKVEYLELIYDLIFVYIIGRNNSLLHHVEGGFISLETFLTYALATLAVIQIWNYSTFYINMFGRNGLRDHIFLFLNMYLLYYIGEGTRTDWYRFQNQYHIAWALILINIGVQYLIERRNHMDEPGVLKSIHSMLIPLFGETLIVLTAIPIFNATGHQIALAAVLFGVIITWILANDEKAEMIDFPHLSERAMLYVVFSFGEMIITISEYFEGGFSLNSLYFSLMCFLIVVALFLCYGFLYDRVIDRERRTTGLLYMIIHIFLIFAMNNITTALSFMREEEISLTPKIVFLTGSMLLYFFCMFALLGFAKQTLSVCRRLLLKVVLISALFAASMIMFKTNMRFNIAISVAYVFAVFIMLYVFSGQELLKAEKEKK
jgi:low temperature requirement protein LtrA